MSSIIDADMLGAAVVTFEPDGGLDQRLSLLHAEIPNLLLVDNSESLLGTLLVRQIAEQLDLQLIANRSNQGVSRAINQALAWAVERDLCWLLLMDQDTHIQNQNLITPYQEILASVPSSQGVAALGIASRAAHRIGGGDFVEADAVITSGCLLRVSAAKSVGGAWEDLFVDGVDTEMCIRLRQAGFHIWAFEHSAFQHRIGEARAVRLFGRTLYVTDHPPVRRYYSTRNRLLIAKRHSMPFGFYSFFREELLAPMFESQSIAKLGAVVLGIWHGLKGITGPAPRNLSR